MRVQTEVPLQIVRRMAGDLILGVAVAHAVGVHRKSSFLFCFWNEIIRKMI